MHLEALDIRSFRNIDDCSIEPHPDFNLITGGNGAGKSSLLEAIQCLSTGHTFRTRKPRELISRGADSLSLIARLRQAHTGAEHRCGVERFRDGRVELRLDYEPVQQLAEITRLLPVKAITPDSLKLLLEGPDERRQFLDWGLFHVEPSFLSHWRQYRRALVQRNQLLRDQAPVREIESWNEPLAISGEALNRLRMEYTERLTAAIKTRVANAGLRFHVELHYRQGWTRERSLVDLLSENLEQHRRLRTTSDGPHRAELQVQTDGVPVRQVLSRGELKSLVYVLQLAQLGLLHEATGQHAVVLCDDLGSELDDTHLHALLAQLRSLGSQIFLASIDAVSDLDGMEAQRFVISDGVLKTGV
ncbi:MAG: DNA replication/repair protein RecF [Gammaproteobacteria bacterium]|nr:MAG: DNA replication/repair protein RecF [Gammaproteobacteria bacterium]